MQLIKVNSNSAIIRHEWHELSIVIFSSLHFSASTSILEFSSTIKYCTIIQWGQVQSFLSKEKKNIRIEISILLSLQFVLAIPNLQEIGQTE